MLEQLRDTTRFGDPPLLGRLHPQEMGSVELGRLHPQEMDSVVPGRLHPQCWLLPVKLLQ